MLRRPMRETWTAAAAVVLTVVGFAASASAQVTYDPESAAGKQYEIPVERVRDDAAGGTGSARPGAGASQSAGASGGATAPAPLFGEGVESVAADAPSRNHNSATSGATRPARAALESNETASARAAERAAEIGAGQGRPWLPFALALLAGAAVVALVLRRTQSASPGDDDG